MERGYVEALGIATCKGLYMAVGLGFRYENHTQIYIYHALTKEIIWKFKTQDCVQCFAFKTFVETKDQKLEASTQTKQLIGQKRIVLYLLTTSGEKMELTEYEKQSKSRCLESLEFNPRNVNQLKSLAVESEFVFNFSGVVSVDGKTIGDSHNHLLSLSQAHMIQNIDSNELILFKANVLVDKIKCQFKSLMAVGCEEKVVLHTDENAIRLISLSGDRIVILKSLKFDLVARSLLPWSKPTALVAFGNQLAIAVDDKCIRTTSIEELQAKENSVLGKRPATKIEQKDSKHKQEEEKPLFSIIRSRVFFQQKSKETMTVTEMLKQPVISTDATIDIALLTWSNEHNREQAL
jgi:hypothetical protein